MNLELLEQFGQNYPEEFDGILDCVTHATTAAFNRRGSVLAVGCNDGRVFLWDFLTRGIAKIIWAHVNAITSLSWSRNGRLLSTSSTDCYVCVWDVLTSDCLIQWHFTTTIFSVQFSPRNSNILLIRRMKERSMLVKYEKGSDNEQHRSHTIIPHDEEAEFDILSTFDRRGEYIYSGNTKGRIQVVRLKPGTIDIEVVTSFRASHSAIKQIEFAPRNKDIFLVNSADRTIRVYDVRDILKTNKQTGKETPNEPEPIQRIQDLVNRTTWKKCCFSGGQESDYICAVSAKSHSLYIYERNVGSLLKILVGTKGETLSDVVWHPIRPVIVSIASGILSIWSQTQVENWSAFAPDFKELEENIEYEERESEFDDSDEDRSPTRNETTSVVDEDIDVDVIEPPTIEAFLSSDEEEEDRDALVYFPVTVDIDDTEMEQNDENAGENSGQHSHLHGTHNKSDKKSTNIHFSKPLHPKNRNVPTVEF